MKKPFKTVDKLVKEALENKPGFTHDEPTVFGNPKNLNKTNQEIASEEYQSTSKPTKKEVATISEARAKAMHLVEKTMIVKSQKLQDNASTSKSKLNIIRLMKIKTTN